MDEEQRRRIREADQAARTMFNVLPQGTLQSVGRAIQRVFSNPQSATMMAGSAGVNPLIATNVPAFPKLGPLVRTDYGLPPSERPDWRNPADQWDARPVNVAPPPTQFVGANPRAATADDLDAFYRRGAYASQPTAQVVQSPQPPQPSQPVLERTPIQTPFGTIYATEQQQKNLAAAQTRQEDRQMALARASEAGFLIGQRLQDESTQRGYAFRQGLAESEAQRAFGSRFGPDYNRAAQASTEAERWKQAQTGRSPFSQEPLNVRGMQVRGVGMGQFAPVRDFGSEWQKNIFGGGPQPASRTAITPNTTNLSKAFGEFEPFSLWRGPEIKS